MTVTRRVLVLVVLFFWQGGFTFYAAVVVPVGARQLGSHRRQALITQPVTDWLNLAGVVALVPLAWDLVPQRRNGVRSLCGAGMGGTLVFLFFFLLYMARQIDPAFFFPPHPEFAEVHRYYLWVSTAQWACAVA